MTALIPASRTVSQTAETLLQEAFYLEVGKCDVEAAKVAYRAVLELKPRSARTAALAHLRLGICHRLTGDESKAKEHFRTVRDRYAAQAEVVTLALHYLGRPAVLNPARFLPPEVLFYAELVDPAEQVETLARLVEGTPFQNPLDYTRPFLGMAGGPTGPDGKDSADAKGTPPSPRASGAVQRAAAILNEGFLKELGKIEGLAVGVPRGAEPDREHLVVFLPGRSDVIRGLLTALLSVRRHVGVKHSFPIYHLEPRSAEGAYLAFGGDVVLMGRPQRLVEEAVERYHSDGPSLAQSVEFKKARSLSAKSSVFAFLGQGWVERLREHQVGVDPLPALSEALDLHRVGPLSATITFHEASDSLRVSARVELHGKEKSRFWSGLRTPPLDRRLLRVVPENCAVILALGLEESETRWDDLAGVVSSLSSLPVATGPKMGNRLEDLGAALREGPLRRFLGALRGVLLGARSGPPGQRLGSLFAILEFAPTEVGDQLLKDALGRLGANAASEVVDVRHLDTEGQPRAIHRLEFLPGIGLNYVRVGDLLVASLSMKTLEEAARAAISDPLIPHWDPKELPSGASKLLLLKRKFLLQAISPGQARLREIGSHVDHVLVYTREEKAGMSLELQVPEISATVRAILNTAAGWLEGPGQRGG